MVIVSTISYYLVMAASCFICGTGPQREFHDLSAVNGGHVLDI